MKVNILTGVQNGGPSNWGRNLAAELNRHNIEAQHIRTLGKLVLTPIRQNADIVHTSLPLSFRLWKKPVIITVHGEYPSETNVWKYFYPAAIKKADIVTTASSFLKERLNLDKAIIIPNAIFPNEFRITEHADKAVINLVTVTNFFFLDKAKGVLEMLRVLESMTEMVAKRIKYIVVGGGPYLEQVKREAPRYQVNVEFTGVLQSPREVLERGDVFLYYSYQDNFPIVILEAMACGLPVITNEVGAVREIIEDQKDGYIATTEDIYLECLLKLINSVNMRAKIGGNGRKAVETKFNWEKIVDRYIEIYRGLL